MFIQFYFYFSNAWFQFQKYKDAVSRHARIICLRIICMYVVFQVVFLNDFSEWICIITKHPRTYHRSLWQAKIHCFELQKIHQRYQLGFCDLEDTIKSMFWSIRLCQGSLRAFESLSFKISKLIVSKAAIKSNNTRYAAFLLFNAQRITFCTVSPMIRLVSRLVRLQQAICRHMREELRHCTVFHFLNFSICICKILWEILANMSYLPPDSLNIHGATNKDVLFM